MKKLFLSAILLTIITLTGQAKQSAIVWANPTVEYSNAYGDGYFNIALDVPSAGADQVMRK